MDSSDRNLVDAHLNGDREAFERIVRRHGAAVLGYLIKMTHNQDKAEDIFQETFRKAYEKARTFRGDNLRPWLIAIAANTALSDRRRSVRFSPVSIDCYDGEHCPASTLADPNPSAGPSDAAVLEEQKEQVRSALMSLPEQQRTAVILYYYHQFSYGQIAEVLDCTTGTIKTSMFRALKKLAHLLPNPCGGIEPCRI